MRLKVELNFPQPSLLSWEYLNHLRGLLYQALFLSNPQLATQLHDFGWEGKSKVYKPLTFSLLFPKKHFATSKHGITLQGQASWFISSPLPQIIEAVATGLLSSDEVVLGNYPAIIDRIEIVKEPDFASPLQVYTLSPICVSTGHREGDKFCKVFLSPKEPDFARVLEENLKRKYLALYRKEPEGEVRFTFLKPWHSRLFDIARTKIRGWEMELVMEGDPELLRLAYQWGLGEHNGSGFGMVATIHYFTKT